MDTSFFATHDQSLPVGSGMFPLKNNLVRYASTCNPVPSVVRLLCIFSPIGTTNDVKSAVDDSVGVASAVSNNFSIATVHRPIDADGDDGRDEDRGGGRDKSRDEDKTTDGGFAGSVFFGKVDDGLVDAALFDGKDGCGPVGVAFFGGEVGGAERLTRTVGKIRIATGTLAVRQSAVSAGSRSTTRTFLGGSRLGSFSILLERVTRTTGRRDWTCAIDVVVSGFACARIVSDEQSQK